MIDTAIVESVGLVKDIVLTIAAVIGGFVAVRGLRTWNRQLKGGVEYELTRRLLKYSYRFRDAISRVRNPLMWSSEMPTPPAEVGKAMSDEDLRYYGLSRAYQLRWDKVNEVRNDLQTELIEAEVLWGRVVYKQFQPLFTLQNELLDSAKFALSFDLFF